MTDFYDPDAIGDEVYEQFAPLVDSHGDPGNHLWIYVHGLGRMFQEVDDIAKDSDDGDPGWSQILDRNRAKGKWLPWLGQWVGYWVREQGTQNYDTWRDIEAERIVTRSAHRRGSVPILREVMQEQLTGLQQVIILERHGDANTIDVYYYTSELAPGFTNASICAAALAQKAAGLIMTCTGLSGKDYNTLNANNATYNILMGKHADLNSVLINPSL